MCTGIYEIQMYCVEQTYIIKSKEMGEINFNNIYLIQYTQTISSLEIQARLRFHLKNKNNSSKSSVHFIFTAYLNYN